MCTISEGDNEVSSSRIGGAASNGHWLSGARRAVTVCDKTVERRHARSTASEISDENGGLPTESQLSRARNCVSAVASECVAKLRCIDASAIVIVNSQKRVQRRSTYRSVKGPQLAETPEEGAQHFEATADSEGLIAPRPEIAKVIYSTGTRIVIVSGE